MHTQDLKAPLCLYRLIDQQESYEHVTTQLGFNCFIALQMVPVLSFIFLEMLYLRATWQR